MKISKSKYIPTVITLKAESQEEENFLLGFHNSFKEKERINWSSLHKAVSKGGDSVIKWKEAIKQFKVNPNRL